MGGPDKEQLLQSLSQDVDEANEAVKQSAVSRGTIPAPETQTSFLPRAIRYKGKVFGEKELGDLHSLIDKATDEIVHTSTKYSNEEKAQIKHELNQRMHEYSMEVLQKTLAFGNHLKQQGYDLEQELASQNAWQQMLSSTTAGIIGYMNKPKDKQAAAKADQALQIEYAGKGRRQDASLGSDFSDPYMQS